MSYNHFWLTRSHALSTSGPCWCWRRSSPPVSRRAQCVHFSVWRWSCKPGAGAESQWSWKFSLHDFFLSSFTHTHSLSLSSSLSLSVFLSFLYILFTFIVSNTHFLSHFYIPIVNFIIGIWSLQYCQAVEAPCDLCVRKQQVWHGHIGSALICFYQVLHPWRLRPGHLGVFMHGNLSREIQPK